MQLQPSWYLLSHRAIGILPLTGTSTADYMKKDLASVELKLPAELIEAMESIAR